MVSVLNKTRMSKFVIPQQLGHKETTSQDELSESLFSAAESHSDAKEYNRALELYFRNIADVAFGRVIEDAGFRTLADILKDEVDSGTLERWCDRPNFFVQDEFHSYVGAAKCAKGLGKEELFRFCLNAAINIGVKRATKDKIYYDYVADCYELLGDSEKTTKFRNKFLIR